MGRFLFVDELYQGIGKSELGIGVFILAGDPGAADKRVIGPENECIRI